MKRLFAAVFAVAAIIAAKTYHDITPVDAGVLAARAQQRRFEVLDRSGIPLAVSYQNALNASDTLPLYAIPPLLKDAFMTAEDRRFYSHHGVDWQARAAALWQDMRARRGVRGASTITEQVVRILHPRPRTVWSRWIEGFEAASLERHASKAQILEFYLNEVPYAAQRRGVAQAARYYFNREVATLTPKEMLALAVLPRAPSAYDLYRHPDKIIPAIRRLAAVMPMAEDARAAILAEAFALERPAPPVDAGHFVEYIREQVAAAPGKLRTTLDAGVQQEVQTALNQRLRELKNKQVRNGAVLVAEAATGEIIAWAQAGAEGQAIDAVRTPRQPGSAMKPLLYALALDSGWSTATIIEDAPISEKINFGLHRFTNYSHQFYGKVTLREALGNSLNIPAIHTIEHVGVARYLATLHRLGIESLNQPADFYNEGLALGDGEVTLFELVQAYTALAHHGSAQPLAAVFDMPAHPQAQVYSDEAASLTGNILSDPWARQLEFGVGSVLNLPVQTAVKTGTSTDYHDAWAIGFNSRYVVGVWMGNLGGAPMDGVTGSTGPALVLRSAFNALTRDGHTQPLYLSPRLVRQDVCVPSPGLSHCIKRTDYFIAGTEPGVKPVDNEPPQPALLRPADGLYLAYDPRLPKEKQAFEFAAEGIPEGQQVGWVLNGEQVAVTHTPHYVWPLSRGTYRLTLQTGDEDGRLHPVDSVAFIVK